MVRVWFQKTLFLSEHAAVYFSDQNPVSNRLLKTTEYQLTEYQLNNDVTITSFCFVKKSCLANSLFSNKMECLCMLQKWLSCGLQLTVQTSLTKTPGRQVARTRIRLTIMFGGRCCRTSVTWIRSQRTSRNWSQRFWRSGMSYHKTQSASRSRISGSVRELV